jgi:N6-adenosine-specific RNA methylase IME4
MSTIVVTDPPWMYSGSQSKMGAAGNHYQCRDIADIPSPMQFDPDIVYCWATCPRLDIAIDALWLWGLHYRGVAFVWVKTRKDGTPLAGIGVRPTHVKPTTELVLVGSKKATGRPVPLMNENQAQVIMASRGRHSEKPQAVYDAIYRLHGAGHTYVDMFARKPRENWEVWGDEL